MFQTEGLLLSWQEERALVSTEYQPEIQRLPETGTSPSFRHKFTTPRKVLYSGGGRQFSMAGTAALTYWKVRVRQSGLFVLGKGWAFV